MQKENLFPLRSVGHRMAKNDQEEAFERLLAATLARVIEFVKFGEAKNAALLTFNSAWMLATINLAHGANPVTDSTWLLALKIALPLFAISGLVSLLSFFPKIKLGHFHKDPSRDKSLLFFGDICEFSPESYRDRVRERYKPPENTSVTQNYLNDLSIQINVNSAIAVWKFQIFKFGVIITAVAIGVMGFPAAKELFGFLKGGP